MEESTLLLEEPACADLGRAKRTSKSKHTNRALPRSEAMAKGTSDFANQNAEKAVQATSFGMNRCGK